MKNVKLRLIMMCTAFLLIFVTPVQMQVTEHGVNVKKEVLVDAKAKKKSVKKKTVKKATVVYVTQYGKCYHSHACGRGSYYKSTLKSAKSRGLRPCKKCY